MGDDREQTLVFTSTRHHTELVHSVLAAQGISCACVYGAMDQVRLAGQSAKYRGSLRAFACKKTQQPLGFNALKCACGHRRHHVMINMAQRAVA